MNNSPQAPKHSSNVKGRRKVKLEKMKNKNHLQVTFSKRHYSLFKKASELCTLTGCEIGVIVNSPGNKVLSFGHPSVHNIIDACFPVEGTRARSNTPLSSSSLQMKYDQKLMMVQMTTDAIKENKMLSELKAQMETAKQMAVLLNEREKDEMVGHMPLKEMAKSELLELGACLNALKQNIEIKKANVPLDPANLNSDFWGVPNLNMMGEVNPMNEFGYQGF